MEKKFYSMTKHQMVWYPVIPLVLMIIGIIPGLLFINSENDDPATRIYISTFVLIFVFFLVAIPFLINAFRVFASYTITDDSVIIRRLLFLKKTVVPLSEIASFSTDDSVTYVGRHMEKLIRIDLRLKDNSFKRLRFWDVVSMKNMATELEKTFKNEDIKFSPEEIKTQAVVNTKNVKLIKWTLAIFIMSSITVSLVMIALNPDLYKQLRSLIFPALIILSFLIAKRIFHENKDKI